MNNTMKKIMFGGALFAAASMAHAGPAINVGGVVWDPDNVSGTFPNLTDFASNGTLIETVTTGVGSTVTGRGLFTNINSAIPNSGSFCPSCELTFTFSMDTTSITPTGPDTADFVFDNIVLNIYVDDSPNYTGTMASAADGDLWLSLVSNGSLTGSGEDIGTGSDTGEGAGLLDVVGGLAMGNFDTNQEVDGADLAFSSSFQPIYAADGVTPTGELFGTWEMTGNSIPEPGALALMGVGLLGFGVSAMRKRKASA